MELVIRNNWEMVRKIPGGYLQPYFSRRHRCIVAGELVWDGETYRYSHYLFEGKFETPLPVDLRRKDPKWDDEYLNTVRFAVTEANLLEMMRLPVDQDSKDECARILEEYLYRPRYFATLCQYYKATLEKKEGIDNRIPSNVRVVKEPVVLTPGQQLAKAFGATFPEYTERAERVPVEDMLEFKKYTMMNPYSQQLIGAWGIYHGRHMPLWFDMRVGKTLSAIICFKRLLYEGKCDLMVVVCPRDNIYHPWVHELEAEGLRPAVLNGTSEQDESILADGDFDVLILNYERVKTRLELLRGYLDERIQFHVYDESTAIKEGKAVRSQMCHDFAFDAAWSTCLNGTPASQGPDSLWSQYRIVDPYGIRWGATFKDFSNRFLEREGLKWVVRQDGVTNVQLEELIMTSSLRFLRFEADQFNGKDKQFRYIAMKPSRQMLDQARNVAKGFSRTIVDGAVKEGKVKNLIIVIYGILRELSCGYDKFQEAEGMPYRRVRHAFDPKLLWVKCFLTAHPNEALVIYTEFNEQEQRLKEMLDEMGVPWSGCKPKAELKVMRRAKELMSFEEWTEFCLIRGHNPEDNTMVEFGGGLYYMCPPILAYDISDLPGHLIEEDEFYVDRKYSDAEKDKAITDFNIGNTQVFICKTIQARGFSLSRKQAHNLGRGDYPSIVRLAPSWSLDYHQQSADRCVCSDDETKKNVCTMEYVLFMPGIEKRIVDALRRKHEVQATLLHDAEVAGYESFVNTLAEEMGGAVDGSDEVFDVEDVQDRIHCGVPPLGKLTVNMIARYCKERGVNINCEQAQRLISKVK